MKSYQLYQSCSFAILASLQDSRREDEVRRMRRMMQGRPEGPNISDGGLTIDDRMPGGVWGCHAPCGALRNVVNMAGW